MSDDLERRLAAAFDDRARAGFPDNAAVPPMRAAGTARPRRRWAAPALAAATVVAAAGIAVAIGSGGRPSHTPPGAVARTTTTAPIQDPRSLSASRPPAPPRTSASIAGGVQVSSPVLADGARVGIGMPILLTLSRPITDARAFAAATVVTANGRRVHGAWFFLTQSALPGGPVEAAYRLRAYWPAHARIHLSLPVRGVPAGHGTVFANDLSLDFTTGAANVVTVDDAQHAMTIVSDGRRVAHYRVSLGAATTPTTRGTKVIMAKGASICMHGPGYARCNIKDTQRLTLSGEYLHAAPWNVVHIADGVDSSNGCTNLTPADAARAYSLLEVGDVVVYPDADGPRVTADETYGGWNLPWSVWSGGGLYRTR